MSGSRAEAGPIYSRYDCGCRDSSVASLIGSMVTDTNAGIAAAEIGSPGIPAGSVDIGTVLPRNAANSLRLMLERHFPGLLKDAHWRLKSSSGRNIVLDLRWENRAAHPPSMIVKCPASHVASVQRNNREVSLMRYLRALPNGDLARLAPEVYVHDPNQGIFAMEDMVVSRGARSLEDVLQLERRQDAAASLQTLARALGRLHLHTFTWQSINTNGAPTEHRNWLMPDFEKAVTVLRRKARKFGSSLEAAGLEELRAIDQLLHRSGVWAFCHGDVSPKNVFLSAEGVHLCDFESSGLLHPILEGTHLGWPFPFSLEAGGIPASVMEEMKAAYRQEFDLERVIGRGILNKVEAAAIIVFLLYHWVYTLPEVGLPIAHSGSRAKVIELMELLQRSTCGFHFPSLTQLLRHLDQSLRKEPALSPERSIMYGCFRDNPVDVIAVAHNTGVQDYRPAEQVSGIFRVNRSCHLIIKKRGSRHLGIYVLEYPHIRCTASRLNNGVFRGIEMPLELKCIAPSIMEIRDLRTSKAINIHRQGLSIPVLRHLRQLREISRYHRSTLPAQSV